ncbi:EfeM/EfeO family lipoprotein [Jatrophihabitans sp.]|uniref:EfeM/EfeO family lipoprotein n=1 Tax=Jatrophihabitans sp. TaxID=1932789 RepID=UPI002B945299|nr:EfeM/EfeO family lipoprotein [Jatrophihabitans sp.]
MLRLGPTTLETTPGRAGTPLGAVVEQYRGYVGQKLDQLAADVANLRAGLPGNDRTSAQRRWLAAQFTWQQVGAAYGSFGALGTAIGGLANGLPQGVADPAFTGLHRIEYGLYSGEKLPDLRGHVDRLAADVDTLRGGLAKLAIVPTDMPIRCHEILEDALRDHLSGQDDYGSGMAYALTSADVLGTRVVLEELKPLIPTPVLGHSPYDQSKAALDRLDAALDATKVDGRWPDYQGLTKHQRQPVNGAIGAALEALYRIPSALGKVQ